MNRREFMASVASLASSVAALAVCSQITLADGLSNSVTPQGGGGLAQGFDGGLQGIGVPGLNVLTGGFVNTANSNFSASAGRPNFKGRRWYGFPFVTTPIKYVQFCFNQWRINASAATPESIYTVQPLTALKTYVACYDSAGNPVGNTAPITVNGIPINWVVPAGAREFFVDKIFPAMLGLATFPAGGWIEWRWVYTLPQGLASATSGQTYEMMQSWNLADGWTDDLASFGAMVAGSSNVASATMTFPNYAVCAGLPSSFRSLLILGDSMAYRQDDITGMGFLFNGGGVQRRAANARKLPYMVMAQGGRTWAMQDNSALCKTIYSRFNCSDSQYSTNDIAFASTLAQIDTSSDSVLAALRMAGHLWIGSQTPPPRTNEDDDHTNLNNLYACTDQSHMTPYWTQALAANGFARDGYGFGAGEARELYNTVTLPAKLAAGKIDSLFDFASFCQDAVTTWKWKLSAYSSILSAGFSANATSCSVVAAPSQYANLVFEPGVANVDVGAQGGPHAWVVSGVGPFTVNFQIAGIAFTGSFGVLPAKTHAISTAVKETLSPDGTHPGTGAIIAATSAKTTQYSVLM